ncbi:MAG: hypothetical protein V4616_06100 [Bacteroidota bacterium]
MKKTADPSKSADEAATPAVVAPLPGLTPLTPTKSDKGVFAPGLPELAAIQEKFPETTMDELSNGYNLYTAGACINCHAAYGIYKRSEGHWRGIIDDMASRAELSEEQKDAVYKYVLSIKGTQPKG